MPPRNAQILKTTHSITARGPTAGGSTSGTASGPSHASNSQAQSRFARLHGMNATQQQQQQSNFVSDFIEKGGANMPSSLTRADTGGPISGGLGVGRGSNSTPESGDGARRSSLPSASILPLASTPSSGTSGGTFLTGSTNIFKSEESVFLSQHHNLSTVTSSNYLAGSSSLSSAQLEQRLKQMQAELDARTDSVNAVQRNFERLSQMYTRDKKQFEEAEEKIRSLVAELESLRAEKKVFVAVRAEFTQLQTSHAKALEDVKALELQNKVAEKKLMEREATQVDQREKAEREGFIRELEAKLLLCQRKIEMGRKQRHELISTIFSNYAKKLRRIGGHAASIIDAMECAVDAHLVSGGSANNFSLSGGGATEAELNSTGDALKAFLQRGASPPDGATRRSSKSRRQSETKGGESEPRERTDGSMEEMDYQQQGDPFLVPELRTIAPTPSRGIGADLTEVFSNTKFSANVSRDENGLRDSSQMLEYDFDNEDGGSSCDVSNGQGIDKGSLRETKAQKSSTDLASFAGVESSGSVNSSNVCGQSESGVTSHAHSLLAAVVPQQGNRQTSFKRRHLAEAATAGTCSDAVHVRTKSVSYASNGPSSSCDDGEERSQTQHAVRPSLSSPPQPPISRSPNVSASSGVIPAPLNPLALSQARPLSVPSSGEANAQCTDRYGNPMLPPPPRQTGLHDEEAHAEWGAPPRSSVSPSRGRKRLNLLSSQFDALESALAACEKEVLPCIVQYLKLSKVLERRSAQQHTYEINRMQDTIDMLVEEKGSLTRTLEEWKEKHGALAAKCLDERHSFQKQIAELEQKVDMTNGEGKRSEDASAKRLSELESKVSRWKNDAERSDQLRAEAQTLVSSLEDQIKGLEDRLRLADASAAEAKKKLESSHMRVEQLEKEIDSLSHRNGSLENLVASLKSEVNSLHASSASGSEALRGEIEVVGSKLRAAEQRISLLEATAENDAKAASQREEELKAQNNTLGEEKLRADKELNAAREEGLRLLRERDALQLELADLRKEHDGLSAGWTSDMKALKLSNSELSVEVATLNQKLELAAKRSESEIDKLKEVFEAQLAKLRLSLDEERRRAEVADAKALAAITAKNKAEQKALELSAAADMADRQRNEQLQRDRDALHKARLSADEQMAKVKALQSESAKAVAKLQAAEQSSESSYSCQSCLGLLKTPMVCAPCGHMYCKTCLEGANRNKQSPARGSTPLFCPECDGHNVVCTAPSPQMDVLASKFEYRKRVLADLAALMAQSIAKEDSM